MRNGKKNNEFYRLKPILMTTIATILALMPFLFGSDLGVALQRPLTLTVIDLF